MFSIANLSAVLALTAGAHALSVRATKPANPIRVNTTATEFLGREKNWPKDNVLRDGGAESVLGGHYYQIYADTCLGYQTDTNGGCQGYPVAGNTIASQTYDPTISQNFDDTPRNFCNTNQVRARLSNMVPIDKTTSALWYVSIDPNQGDRPVYEENGYPDQVGVAVATVNSTGQPSCSVGPGLWNPRHEPQWGNTQALGPLLDGHFYLYASLDANAPGGNLSNVFMARVYPNKINDVNSYEYWNGQAYTSQRLIDPSPSASILQGVSVGSAFYSAYYKKYVVLSSPNLNDVVAYTANSPEGPYSDPVTLWSNSTYGPTLDGKNGLYAPEAVTALDSSGKTLIVNLSWRKFNAVSVILRLHFL